MRSRRHVHRRHKNRRILSVRFAEVEFERPPGRGMIIELEGGVRLLVAEEPAVELAAQLINYLWALEEGGVR